MRTILLNFSFLVFSFSLCYAQTTDEIVNKCMDALGGKEKLSSIKTLYEEGNIDAGGAKIKIKYWAINKTGFRFESEINGMRSFTIVRNDSGWNYSPRRGQKAPEPMPAQSVRLLQPSLDIQGLLLNYKDKGYTVNYLGKSDEVDGSDAYKLELKVNDSLVITYFIDPDSYFIMRDKTKKLVNGRTAVSINDYSIYTKTADGYIFPMQVNRTKYTLVKVNTEIDKTLFSPGKR